ncbi:23S rRNA (pseudouridine(1915)-N(3))-methyltransferase RlmH [Selenihalanaerobacter shriftii]|uniref:Ribosomal RNA large subunit methyltransferase H n=1 Tax=Selenihalanaerobacter shriftii TaxID=142842 RepID=A0A1T4L3Y5_9FIRM|nr:23S rRNA (pseudouridine(1915)-N(3))-methyltransferase RlmH [Selenihalanaerobacter shriftii]SJZ49442.1 23S rRNA (pseudouridine1915-N3)-methyltransferase [Selenihalanaerobacter shriftii]
MKINVIALGKLKSDYIQAGAAEFIKRLSRYADLNIIELRDERIGSNLSNAEKDQIKKKEAKKIKEKVSNTSYSIALDPQGKHMTSPGLAKSIGNLQVQGYSEIDFIIGGALGLHKDINKLADYVLSFSNMTFTHEMIRLLLLEQIYRAFKIMRGEEYHR